MIQRQRVLHQTQKPKGHKVHHTSVKIYILFRQRWSASTVKNQYQIIIMSNTKISSLVALYLKTGGCKHMGCLVGCLLSSCILSGGVIYNLIFFVVFWGNLPHGDLLFGEDFIDLCHFVTSEFHPGNTKTRFWGNKKDNLFCHRPAAKINWDDAPSSLDFL